MFELLTSIGRLAIGFLGILGPVVFLIICLHVRDQRKSILYAIVLAELNRPHLRGLYTVRAKIRPLWADTVVIDLWNCSREQVWHVVERLSTKVPPRVQVEVNGISDCRVRFTGEKKGISYPIICPAFLHINLKAASAINAYRGKSVVALGCRDDYPVLIPTGNPFQTRC